MFISTLETIPGHTFQILGIAQGLTVQTRLPGLKLIAHKCGNEIEGHSKMFREARQIAIQRMCDEATQMGANAVIGVRFSSNGKIPEAIEVLAYGTAVKAVQKKV